MNRVLSFLFGNPSTLRRARMAGLLAVALGIAAQAACARAPAPAGADAAASQVASAAVPALPAQDASAPDPYPMKALPLRRDSDSDAVPAQMLFRSFALVVLIGLLAVGVLWRARRRPRDAAVGLAIGGWRRILSPASTSSLRLLSSVRLSPRASVHVVQWDGREWLLACSDERVTQLAERELADAEVRP